MNKLLAHYRNFSEQISLLEKESQKPLELALKIQKVYSSFVGYFFDFERNLSFKNKKDESHYFGSIKTSFLSQFIYAKKLIEIETSYSFVEDKNKLIDLEFQKINYFKQKHHEALKHYYEKNEHIFVKEQCSLQVFDELLFAQVTLNTIPQYDILFAFFQAFPKIELYLYELKHKKEQLNMLISLAELFTQRELGEFTQALHALKGQGKVTIKDLTNQFCYSTGVKQFNPYECFNEISNRTGSKTIFLDKLKNALENKIDEKFKR